MSQQARAPRPPVDDTDIKVRNQRMLMVAGVMAVLAFVVAAGYWYTHQPGKAPAPPTKLSIIRVGGDLVVGEAKATHHLVITESFACGRCATFERSVQTFLRADAAAGIVQVQYVIPSGSDPAYDKALSSNPVSALDYHDRAFASGSPTAHGDLKVVLDGKTLAEADPLDLANALETALAQ